MPRRTPRVFRMPRLSLGARWALGFGGVAVLTLAALFGFVENRVNHLVRADGEEMLELLVEHAEARAGETREEQRQRLEMEWQLAEQDHKVAFAVYDPQQRRIFSVGHAVSQGAPAPDADPVEGDPVFRELDLGSKYPYWTLFERQPDGTTVQATLYSREFVRRGRRIEGSFLMVLAIAALGFAAAGLLMTRSFLGPVRSMVSSIEAMGARSLDARLPVSGRDDELDRIAESFNRLVARLEESFGTLRGFTGDVAHQLRSPLTALRSRIEVALREESLPPEAVAVLEGVHGDVLRLNEIVDAMLRLSRYTAGLDPRQRQRVDLAREVRAVAEFLEPLAAERGIRLRVAPCEAAPVVGDASWLRQLLVNLAENALEHTPDGGRIGLEVAVQGDAVRVCVSDSGPGIPEAYRTRVFERFFRGATRGGRPGLGLGLAIAKEIAEVHDGTLQAARRDGGGTTITLKLPRAPAAPGAPPGGGAVAAAAGDPLPA